jgi:hypothetical protein
MKQINEKKAFINHDSSFKNVILRTLIEQKEQTASKYKQDNEQLHNLLLKQQDLLNKLNEDNLTLARINQAFKSNLNRTYLTNHTNDTALLTREEYINLL